MYRVKRSVIAIILVGAIILSPIGTFFANVKDSSSINVVEAATKTATTTKNKNTAEKKYKKFLKNKKYETYFTDSLTGPANGYTYLDIDQNGIPEMLIESSGDGFGWCNVFVFTYDKKNSKIVFVENLSNYGTIRYSEKYKALVYTDYKTSIGFAIWTWNKLKDSTLYTYMSVGWDDADYTTGERKYCKFISGKRKSLSEKKANAYFDELKVITFKNMP